MNDSSMTSWQQCRQAVGQFEDGRPITDNAVGLLGVTSTATSCPPCRLANAEAEVEGDGSTATRSSCSAGARRTRRRKEPIVIADELSPRILMSSAAAAHDDAQVSTVHRRPAVEAC